jgi:hypothetical protein
VLRLKRRFAVRSITVIGQRGKRAVGASLTIVTFSAFVVVGLILLGSRVVAAFQEPGLSPQANRLEGLIATNVLQSGQLGNLLTLANQVEGLGQILIGLDYYIDFVNPNLRFLDRLFATYYAIFQSVLGITGEVVDFLGFPFLAPPLLPPLPSPASPYF